MHRLRKELHGLQTGARGAVCDFDDPLYGRVVEYGPGPKLSESPGRMRWMSFAMRTRLRADCMLTLQQCHSLALRYQGLSSLSLPALRFGQRLDLITHGLLGHVYYWRGDFRSLIDSIAAYMRVRIPLLGITLADGTDHFGVRIECHGGSAGTRAFLLQVALGTFHTLCRSVTPNIAIHCRHDLFDDVAAARQLLQAELNTDHDITEMRFYARTLRNAATGAPAPSQPVVDPYEEPAFVVRLRNALLAHLGRARRDRPQPGRGTCRGTMRPL